jgi:hypothetical protein
VVLYRGYCWLGVSGAIVAPGALSRGNGGIPHYSMRKHRHQCSMCEKNQDDGRQSFAPRLSRLTDMVDSTRF